MPKQIIHVELSQPLKPIQLDAGYTAAYVVFWWHGVPLGHRELCLPEELASAEQLADMAIQTITPALERYCLEYGVDRPAEASYSVKPNALERWREPVAQLQNHWSTPTPSTTVSVVICTRDRPDYLERCLRSLQTLVQPPEEILVVDNAPSSDATQQLVARIPGIRYIREPRPGLDFARNAGLRHSTGDVIAYIDDDVTVHANWVVRLRQAFRESKVMAVTGLVIAAELDTESQYIFEKYWSFNRGYQALLFDHQFFEKYRLVGAPAWRIGAGANMAFRREVVDRIGYFDERLDVGAAGCSGDSEFWYRVLAEGFACRYEPTAVTYHCHRREMAGLQKQIFYYMRGHVTELLIRFEKYHHWGNLVRLALLPVYFAYVILLGVFREKLRLTTLKSEILGCFSGFKFYFENRPSKQRSELSEQSS